jgi:hypothetical protein
MCYKYVQFEKLAAAYQTEMELRKLDKFAEAAHDVPEYSPRKDLLRLTMPQLPVNGDSDSGNQPSRHRQKYHTDGGNGLLSPAKVGGTLSPHTVPAGNPSKSGKPGVLNQADDPALAAYSFAGYGSSKRPTKPKYKFKLSSLTAANQLFSTMEDSQSPTRSSVVMPHDNVPVWVPLLTSYSQLLMCSIPLNM